MPLGPQGAATKIKEGVLGDHSAYTTIRECGNGDYSSIIIISVTVLSGQIAAPTIREKCQRITALQLPSSMRAVPKDKSWWHSASARSNRRLRAEVGGCGSHGIVEEGEEVWCQPLLFGTWALLDLLRASGGGMISSQLIR